MRDVLVLNGDSQPMSIIPLSVISWQEAVKLIYLEKVSVVEIYDIKLSSQRMTMAMPSVIMAKKYYKNNYEPEFNRANLLYRDEFKCQYCAREFLSKDLTIDHVIPRSHGGKKVWTNAVMACRRCNAEKADKYREPLIKPHKPTYYELVSKRRKYPIIIPDDSWNNYLFWDENLIKYGKSQTLYRTNFLEEDNG